MDQTAPSSQEGASEDGGETLFSAVLRPHRSLPPRGFAILMGAVAGVSFAAGTAFVYLGAWPVMGFFGLDALLVYLAFRLNYRAGRLYETVDLTEQLLTVTRVRPSGRVQSWRFNPYWVRLALTPRTGQGSELALSSHGRRLVIATFLSEEERKSFAEALQDALIACRGGPRI